MFDAGLEEWLLSLPPLPEPAPERFADLVEPHEPYDSWGSVEGGVGPAEPPGLGELPGSGFAALELDWATACAAAMPDGEVLDGIVGWDRVISWAQARQARLLAEFRARRGDTAAAAGEARPSVASRYAPDEVGVALRLSRGEATARLDHAGMLAARLPAVLDAWEVGALDAGKVRTITDTVGFLDPAHAAAVVARVLGRAALQSRGQLRAALARADIAVDPEGADTRQRAARRDRRVSVTAQPEGMASLWAYLTAPDARSCWEWLTRLARGLGAQDPRRMDTRRADLLVALLTGKLTCHDPAHDTHTHTDDTGPDDTGPTAATGREPGRPARERITPVTPGKPLITIVIPHSTLLGADHQPCELAGYGPLPAGLARDIAAHATWRRLVTDPLSGTLLDHGRTTYHPPAGLADHVKARDVHCRFAGCRRPTRR